MPDRSRRRALTRSTMATVLCATLAACYGPLKLADQTPAPARYTEATSSDATPPDDAALAVWWQQYHDETMTYVVTTALAQNQDIRIAAGRLDEARATIDAARSQLFPTIGAGVDGLRYYGGPTSLEFQQLLGVNDLTAQMWRGALQAQWEVDVFGRGRDRLSATKSLATAAAGDVEAVRLSVAAAAADLYINYRGLQQQHDLLRASESIASDFVTIAQKSFTAGVVLSTDIRVAQAGLAQVRARLADVDVAIAQARLGLENLCALPPGSLTQRLAGTGVLPSALPAIGPGQPIDLMRRRPDLIAAQARLEASIRQSDAARKNYWPTFSLAGTLARNGWQLAGQTLAPSTFWLFNIAAMVPLIDFGARKSQVDASDARAQQALAMYDKTAMTALFDVERALARLSRQAEVLASRREEVAQRNRVLSNVQRQYAVGDNGRLDIDQSRLALLESQSAQVREQVAQLQAQVALFRAMGGGWQANATPGEHAAADTTDMRTDTQ
ncbi:efflux transporter outer membrane subunit [Pandoraea sp. ISTKB]|uniref:efflux transporter outer membrane subunit n=1 Tax=Pandoraea sp. ISTKB TaxID=1586708 RepID=UPI001980AC2D|nr:efflux transporter outer membrane subunit [Pandoraea sp. ISTKB]